MDSTHPSEARTARRAHSARQEAAAVAAIQDPWGRVALRSAFHLRRYSVVYGLTVLAAIAVLLMPTVAQTGASDLTGAAGQSNGGAYGGASPGAGAGADAAAPTAQAAVPSGAAGASGANTGAGAGAGSASGAGPVAAVQVGTGQTRGGFPCSPGVHQLPYSQYAAPCVAKFTGNNGGATYNGVTASTITVALRRCQDAQGSNAAAVYAENQAAGAEPPDVGEAHAKQLITYLSQVFELYGRHIQFAPYDGTGKCVDESTGNGLTAACSDANTAANSLHAFTDLNPYNGFYESEPFAQCAAKYHMYLGFAQLYFPESEYQAENPYIWAPTPSCTRGGLQEAEFIGKQLAPYPARWAGTYLGVSLNGQPRRFAVMTPSNQGYQECADTVQTIDQQQYGVAGDRFDRYNYPLDISQWPQQANSAATQFAAKKDTTVILACDPLIPIFLTQDAHNQQYFPEWMLTGVALTDQDNLAQLWDQTEIKGHLFGLSQLGSYAKFQDPNGEAATTLKAAGIPVNQGTVLTYYELLPIFDQLQAAGPVLTPANIAAGTRSLPRLGGSTAADGTWYYGTSHTAIIDSREIYYDETKTSPDGKAGTYVEIYGGRRYEVGQYPTGEPPFYSS
jgi:hypothetical protein